MNINRNNYEEYFFLYIDGEMSAQNRQKLENFVVLNPDLKKELDTLKHTIQHFDDNIVYPNKFELLKTSSNQINEINYLNFFLLYVDNELDEKQRIEVEKFGAENFQLQNELNLLLSTVNIPESIVFENKELLLRHEDKRPAEIFNLRFTTWAVAAVLFLFCISAWQFWKKPTINNNLSTILKPEIDKDQIAAKNKSKDSSFINQKSIPIRDTQNNSSLAEVNDKRKDTKKEVVYSSTKIKATNDKLFIDTRISKADSDIQTSETSFAYAEPSKIIPQNNVNGDHNPVTIANSSRLLNDRSNEIAENAFKIKPVSYKEINTEQDINDRNLYVGALNLNKDKVKGLFRKVTGLFNQKALESSQNNEVSIAGIKVNKN